MNRIDFTNSSRLTSGNAPIWRADARAVHWKQVGMFIGLTFGLSWLLDLGVYLAGGLVAPAAGLVLQTQMLIPAFSALVLETFLFADSPLFYKTNRSRVRWFTYFFMAMSAFCIFIATATLVEPSLTLQMTKVFAVVITVGLVVPVVVRWKGGKDVFVSAGMGGGQVRWWVIIGLGLAGFYALQTLLNYLFQMGTLVDVKAIAPVEMASWPVFAIHGFLIVSALAIGPLGNILLFFGEEYGWRGFLQRTLARMGRIPGVLLVGVIWGVWHAPVILMGYNYPDQPVVGVFMMTLFSVLGGFLISYSVYKAKGVWAAAFVHGVNNSILNYLFGMVHSPASPILSFGVGLYGMVIWAVAIALILRDPVWRERD